jgi:hypothetical protein
MASGYCSFCGYDKPPLDRHHVAGFVNHPFWVVTVCKQCHYILTAWQYTDRTPLVKEREPPEEVKHRAITQGLQRCGELICHLEGRYDLLTFISALGKMQTDRMTAPDATRLFSDTGSYPKMKPTNPAPVPSQEITESNRKHIVAAQCGMLAYLLEDLLGESNAICVKLRSIERNPSLYIFVDEPPMFDFTSLETIEHSIRARLRMGFVGALTDWASRFKFASEVIPL